MGRKKNLFVVADTAPYELSRSGIENFMRCRRCFYLDKKHGIKQPSMCGSNTLNNAVDALLKKEFDQYRIEKSAHPYMIENAIDAIPFYDPNLNDWRMIQRGIKYHHKATNFTITGAVDDVWINPQGELIIVDYKATSTNNAIVLSGSYKRQIEIYQWLFRKNNFKVSDIGYFLYCNGDKSRTEFESTLHFNVSPLSCIGDDSWIEDVLFEIKDCLEANTLPSSSITCPLCAYCNVVNNNIVPHKQSPKFSLISIKLFFTNNINSLFHYIKKK